MGKKALVTGAARGIGRAVAEELAGQGFDLLLTCLHSIDELNAFCLYLEEKYDIACTSFQGDMGDYETVNRLFESVSGLDVLVNNAGISYIGLLTCRLKNGGGLWPLIWTAVFIRAGMPYLLWCMPNRGGLLISHPYGDRPGRPWKRPIPHQRGR